MKEAADFHDRKRLFYSTVMNDNPIDCIISKVIVAQIPPKVSSNLDFSFSKLNYLLCGCFSVLNPVERLARHLLPLFAPFRLMAEWLVFCDFHR